MCNHPTRNNNNTLLPATPPPPVSEVISFNGIIIDINSSAKSSLSINSKVQQINFITQAHPEIS